MSLDPPASLDVAFSHDDDADPEPASPARDHIGTLWRTVYDTLGDVCRDRKARKQQQLLLILQKEHEEAVDAPEGEERVMAKTSGAAGSEDGATPVPSGEDGSDGSDDVPSGPMPPEVVAEDQPRGADGGADDAKGEHPKDERDASPPREEEEEEEEGSDDGDCRKFVYRPLLKGMKRVVDREEEEEEEEEEEGEVGTRLSKAKKVRTAIRSKQRPPRSAMVPNSYPPALSRAPITTEEAVVTKKEEFVRREEEDGEMFDPLGPPAAVSCSLRPLTYHRRLSDVLHWSEAGEDQGVRRLHRAKMNQQMPHFSSNVPKGWTNREVSFQNDVRKVREGKMDPAILSLATSEDASPLEFEAFARSSIIRSEDFRRAYVETVHSRKSEKTSSLGAEDEQPPLLRPQLHTFRKVYRVRVPKNVTTVLVPPFADVATCEWYAKDDAEDEGEGNSEEEAEDELFVEYFVPRLGLENSKERDDVRSVQTAKGYHPGTTRTTTKKFSVGYSIAPGLVNSANFSYAPSGPTVDDDAIDPASLAKWCRDVRRNDTKRIHPIAVEPEERGEVVRGQKKRKSIERGVIEEAFEGQVCLWVERSSFIENYTKPTKPPPKIPTQKIRKRKQDLKVTGVRVTKSHEEFRGVPNRRPLGLEENKSEDEAEEVGEEEDGADVVAEEGEGEVSAKESRFEKTNCVARLVAIHPAAIHVSHFVIEEVKCDTPEIEKGLPPSLQKRVVRMVIEEDFRVPIVMKVHVCCPTNRIKLVCRSDDHLMLKKYGPENNTLSRPPAATQSNYEWWESGTIVPWDLTWTPQEYLCQMRGAPQLRSSSGRPFVTLESRARGPSEAFAVMMQQKYATPFSNWGVASYYATFSTGAMSRQDIPLHQFSLLPTEGNFRMDHALSSTTHFRAMPRELSWWEKEDSKREQEEEEGEVGEKVRSPMTPGAPCASDDECGPICSLFPEVMATKGVGGVLSHIISFIPFFEVITTTRFVCRAFWASCCAHIQSRHLGKDDIVTILQTSDCRRGRGGIPGLAQFGAVSEAFFLPFLKENHSFRKSLLEMELVLADASDKEFGPRVVEFKKLFPGFKKHDLFIFLKSKTPAMGEGIAGMLIWHLFQGRKFRSRELFLMLLQPWIDVLRRIRTLLVDYAAAVPRGKDGRRPPPPGAVHVLGGVGNLGFCLANHTLYLELARVDPVIRKWCPFHCTPMQLLSRIVQCIATFALDAEMRSLAIDLMTTFIDRSLVPFFGRDGCFEGVVMLRALLIVPIPKDDGAFLKRLCGLYRIILTANPIAFRHYTQLSMMSLDLEDVLRASEAAHGGQIPAETALALLKRLQPHEPLFSLMSCPVDETSSPDTWWPARFGAIVRYFRGFLGPLNRGWPDGWLSSILGTMRYSYSDKSFRNDPYRSHGSNQNTFVPSPATVEAFAKLILDLHGSRHNVSIWSVLSDPRNYSTLTPLPEWAVVFDHLVQQDILNVTMSAGSPQPVQPLCRAVANADVEMISRLLGMKDKKKRVTPGAFTRSGIDRLTVARCLVTIPFAHHADRLQHSLKVISTLVKMQPSMWRTYASEKTAFDIVGLNERLPYLIPASRQVVARILSWKRHPFPVILRIAVKLPSRKLFETVWTRFAELMEGKGKGKGKWKKGKGKSSPRLKSMMTEGKNSLPSVMIGAWKLRWFDLFLKAFPLFGKLTREAYGWCVVFSFILEQEELRDDFRVFFKKFMFSRTSRGGGINPQHFRNSRLRRFARSLLRRDDADDLRDIFFKCLKTSPAVPDFKSLYCTKSVDPLFEVSMLPLVRAVLGLSWGTTRRNEYTGGLFIAAVGAGDIKSAVFLLKTDRLGRLFGLSSSIVKKASGDASKATPRVPSSLPVQVDVGTADLPEGGSKTTKAPTAPASSSSPSRGGRRGRGRRGASSRGSRSSGSGRRSGSSSAPSSGRRGGGRIRKGSPSRAAKRTTPRRGVGSHGSTRSKSGRGSSSSSRRTPRRSGGKLKTSPSSSSSSRVTAFDAKKLQTTLVKLAKAIFQLTTKVSFSLKGLLTRFSDRAGGHSSWYSHPTPEPGLKLLGKETILSGSECFQRGVKILDMLLPLFLKKSDRLNDELLKLALVHPLLFERLFPVIEFKKNAIHEILSKSPYSAIVKSRIGDVVPPSPKYVFLSPFFLEKLDSGAIPCSRESYLTFLMWLVQSPQCSLGNLRKILSQQHLLERMGFIGKKAILSCLNAGVVPQRNCDLYYQHSSRPIVRALNSPGCCLSAPAPMKFVGAASMMVEASQRVRKESEKAAAVVQHALAASRRRREAEETGEAEKQQQSMSRTRRHRRKRRTRWAGRRFY